MIRNVIFDMGGVLIVWDPARIISRLGLPEEDGRLLRREVFDTVEWVSLDRGTLSELAALERFRSRLPARLHAAAERCVYWWKEDFWPVAGMDALIRELKERGYGIYLLSNATRALHSYFPRLPGADCFHGKFVSADWELLKPQHEIYERFFAVFSLNPAECFFTDDAPANIEGARRAGMEGAVFYGDCARLRRELRAAGIEVEAAI